jgi:hypothetical protein
MTLSPEQRSALELLAAAGARGCTESIMLAHSFKIELLDGLVRDGLATAEPDRVRAGGRSIEVRVLITDADGGRSRGAPDCAHDKVALDAVAEGLGICPFKRVSHVRIVIVGKQMLCVVSAATLLEERRHGMQPPP